MNFLRSLFKTPIRINSILFAIGFAALGNNILIVMLPINLEDAGVSVSSIGSIMSFYSIGILLGSNYGHKVITRVGHNRSYASVAALISCTAVMHVFFQSLWLMMILRLLVGVSMAVIYITLESWLNATSEKESRGSIYALYQFFFAIGVFCAPFSITLIDPLESKSFAIIALFLSLSLIPLSLSRFPSPVLKDNQNRLSILEMLRDTPSGSISAIISGLALSALYIFVSIYAIWLGFDKTQMALLIATATGSAIIFQIPMGKLADKFDERKIIWAVSFLALIASMGTYLISINQFEWWFYLIGVFFVGGFISCLYPLSVNFIFSQIDANKAVPAMSSLLIIHSFGLILGPILCSILMDVLDISALFIYLAILMAISTVFIGYRVYVSRYDSQDKENIPYVITFQMLRPGNYSFDPRSEYLVTRVNNPLFASLANAIAISPRKTEKLIKTNLGLLQFTPEEILVALVMHKPRKSKEIIAAMVSIYPNKEIDFTYALKDLIAANKEMINSLLKLGLKLKADEATKAKIDGLFKEFIESNQVSAVSGEINENNQTTHK